MRKLAAAAIAALAMNSCAPAQLYNWNGYDSAVYSYTKASDEKSLNELMNTYEKLINNQGTSNRPAPGICADYGFLLIQKGEKEKGIKLLKQEIEYYPESATFIGRIIKRAEQ